MLAPPTDFGYSPTHAAAYHQQQQQQQQQQQAHQHHQQQQHQHSDERPKLFGLEPPNMHGMTMMGVHDYHHQMVHHGTPQHAQHHAMTPQHAAAMTPQHAAAMTPQHQQHHHQGGVEYDHEPLVMNVQPSAQFYPPMGAHMLMVSSDYDYGSNASTEGATPKNKSGTKRSREDLNLKEKKRMFKLNDRITQLKQMLDEAGVQTKKNKQSVLDNAAYFIEQLRSDLLIAKQKADRAEKEAEELKAQAHRAVQADPNSVFQGCFQKSTTPRVVVDLNLQPVTLNTAFLKHTGYDNKYLQKKENVAPCLCVDATQLAAIVMSVCAQNKPTSVAVTSATAKGAVAVTLLASAIHDECGKASSIEFSLIPGETAPSTSAVSKKKKKDATAAPAASSTKATTASASSKPSASVKAASKETATAVVPATAKVVKDKEVAVAATTKEPAAELKKETVSEPVAEPVVKEAVAVVEPEAKAEAKAEAEAEAKATASAEPEAEAEGETAAKAKVSVL